MSHSDYYEKLMAKCRAKADAKKEKDNHDLFKAMDKLKDKYGKNILLRASALTENSTAIERHNQIGGHRK